MWVSSYIGVTGNEMADKSEDLATNNSSSYNHC